MLSQRIKWEREKRRRRVREKERLLTIFVPHFTAYFSIDHVSAFYTFRFNVTDFNSKLKTFHYLFLLLVFFFFSFVFLFATVHSIDICPLFSFRCEDNSPLKLTTRLSLSCNAFSMFFIWILAWFFFFSLSLPFIESIFVFLQKNKIKIKIEIMYYNHRIHSRRYASRIN